MAGKTPSYPRLSHPKECKYCYDAYLYYDDNDYSDEKTIPRTRPGMSRGEFYFEYSKIILSTIAIIIFFISANSCMLWITWNFLKTGNIDFLADKLRSIADFVQEVSSAQFH
ncbi:hypothetical protein VE01_00589 [Pseudogymnoascus verrucosus]|uniref:Uncharacterized protein n=1 Tax=Pseudogymnoascus verrucosus TaxID=342668 RepID=A0A2P2SWR4_9PEZI|nr:uncharacterized protein VE01_00589 [Pseudogymnoascus verrucosus]OBU01252.1 hypothetical protein VE01_00589 [Pseudogymnoascus verrucosus]